nr:CoA ester lyase [Porphyrobacter sp. GA68]
MFVPGSRPDRFVKARGCGAGLTIIDLEDAVGSADKEEARCAAFREAASDPVRLAIRINAVTTRAGIADLHYLADAQALPQYLMLPMVESAAELAVVRGALGTCCPPLLPLVETPRGLRHLLDIARNDAVAAVMLGGADFSAELGVELAWESMLGTRHQFVLACAEAGKPAIDAPFVALDDDEALAEECRRARAIGFSAKAAIHPRQVPIMEKAFRPTVAEQEEAAEAIRVYEEAGGKAIRHRGRMLEAPLVKRYQAIRAKGERSHA